MMVKVLIYAYATGTCSSRRTARRLEEDVASRMLAAGDFPQRRTVCEFRHRHLDDFRALFVEVVRVARAMGLARFGALSVDGTKVRANASKRKAMSYERMQKEEARLEREVGELLAAARSADEEEDALHGESVRGDEAPEVLRGGKRRRAAIREAGARLDAEASEAPPRPKTKPSPAARDASGEPARQEVKPDAAPAAREAFGDPLLELRLREPEDDPGVQGPAGGGGPRRRRRPEAAAVRSRHRRVRPEGPERLAASGGPDHEDLGGGLPAMLQRAAGGRRGEPDRRRIALGPGGIGPEPPGPPAR